MVFTYLHEYGAHGRVQPLEISLVTVQTCTVINALVLNLPPILGTAEEIHTPSAAKQFTIKCQYAGIPYPMPGL